MADYEVTDIYETGYACRRKGKPFFDDVIIENTKYILEELAGFKNCEVYIPAGAYSNVECEREKNKDLGLGYYQYDWNAICEFPDGIKRDLAGTSYGTLECDFEETDKFNNPCETRYTLIDMDLETGF